MTLLLVVSVIVTALSTPLLAWLVARSVDQGQAERERLDRIMRASTPPSAPGLRPHRRQVH